jgi:hypothetical protein
MSRALIATTLDFLQENHRPQICHPARSAPGFPATQHSPTSMCAAFVKESRMKFANAAQYQQEIRGSEVEGPALRPSQSTSARENPPPSNLFIPTERSVVKPAVSFSGSHAHSGGPAT